MRLALLLGLVIAGLVLTSIVSALLMLIAGFSIPEIMHMAQSGTIGLTPALTRAMLAAQHLLFFILPALCYGLIIYRTKILSGLDLQHTPGWLLGGLGILFLIAAYPLVNLSFIINEAIPLPEWAKHFESQAEDTLKAILAMDTPLVFLINLIIIGILPGIGEELIFRGILQKQIGSMMKSPILGIWMAAFIFSAIHLQFEGFLPRMVLGAVLGYLYYWTSNLWVPILAHAFNNGVQVFMIYVTDLDISTFDEQSSDQLKWWMVPISLIVMFLIYSAIIKNRKPIEQT
jgi:membrane protease YdiL (CAAX protease family)